MLSSFNRRSRGPLDSGRGFLHAPVIQEVMLIATLEQQFFEATAEVVIVRAILELESLCIFKISSECRGKALAEGVHTRRDLLLHDFLVFLLLALSLDALPRELSFNEVDKHVADCL